MCALRNKLKHLDELIVKQKYENHVIPPYDTIELWQMVRDGKEKEVYPYVTDEVKECLEWIKSSELASKQTPWDYF